ncbi:hypothetical protein JH06_1558 [Blastocystis sp. subtype 4]|uniref:hypothetical protein n=1 Tax=Blastocystis sp. subtype 4 TaxID=944170 RepID=UPI00071155E7|nr:hypothetical protein JH06_1558 [Blastocystis sp. subtype 4]KNB46031.1 hypothetical protein JH06_1558 [Blastocystis sp. subtype 4]|eukprot:XP_014529474.1 hypothetical protein JH06_1558 [Blastocystis sp. subtype 4]
MVNELGFHGSMNPSRLMEKELFDSSEHVTEGINFDTYDTIHVEVSGEDVPNPIMEFTKETVPNSLFRNIIRCQYKRPTPVQKYGLAIGISGRDLMACAQTGSGKTAGFLFPIICSMLRDGPTKRELPHARMGKHFPTTLILSPTRELALQIHEECQRFCYCTGIAAAVVYGGTNMRDTLRALERGCDILIGTPGRLLDLIQRDYVGLEGVTHLVMDEADRMLDMGFEPQIRDIVESEGMSQERQTMMFSATFPNEIQRLAGDFLRNYVFLAVGRVGSAAQNIEQRVMYVEEQEKREYLLHELENWGDGRVLIFVETKRKADMLQRYLYDQRFYVSTIHGDRSQSEREEALNAFKSNRVQILVATDVAARGLDIPDVSLVVNYDTPQNIDDYVHRIGRTGRAGNTGVAISFINEGNRPIANDLYDLLIENSAAKDTFILGGSLYVTFSRGGRNFGGRDIRRGAQRSMRSFGRMSGDRKGRGSLGKRDSGYGKDSEVKDSWD